MIKNKKAKVFDGIRGLAFLLVLVVHGIALNVEGSGYYLQGSGKYGVWLFFVLSAFLLTKNYLEVGSSKLEYILSRLIRIVPLYIVACYLYFFFDISGFEGGRLGEILLLWYGPVHLWTIPVEFYFYFFLLVLWVFIKNTRFRDFIFLISALISLMCLWLFDKADNSLLFLWFLPAFFCGYGLARIWNALPSVSSKVSLGVVLLTFFALLMLIPGSLWILFDIEPSSYLMNAYFPISIVWGVFIYVVAKSESLFINCLFNSRAMVFLGKISYSGYLLHWLFIEKIKLLGLGFLSSVLLGWVLSALAGYIGYLVVEKPLLGFKFKLFSFISK